MAFKKRKRKRVSGSGPSVIGKRRRRHHKKRHHRMSGSSPSVIGRRGHHKKKRRIRGPESDGVTEFFGLVLGTGVGLFASEITGRAITGGMATPGTVAGLAVGKIALGAGTFYVGKTPLRNNSFVKGLGVGMVGSAANDGFRALQGAGVISGPNDVVIKIEDKTRKRRIRGVMNGALEEAPAGTMILSKPMQSDGDEWHEAHVLNS